MELRDTDTKNREEVVLAIVDDEDLESVTDYLELVYTILFLDLMNEYLIKGNGTRWCWRGGYEGKSKLVC